MHMKKSVEVAIMGKKFMVRSDSEEAYVQRVARLVNDRISEITAKTNSVPSINIVILAAMNIADEYLRSHSEPSQIGEVKKRIQELIDLIDLNL